MPSLLPDYQYDVFISYRQNDNQSGWISAFVRHLNEELATTMKESVSVYQDINPHDGLLETHNVDKSLEGKLKCLLFIPIISQTYCDPKSFAWQYEFSAFNQLAKGDQLGRDIKLSNGNVASRILPVKIHDLDGDDLDLLEGQLGGPLRAIEFIFKSTGVNRPLQVDDKREENLNRLFYRDQINKVANAIKEIIHGILYPHKKSRPEDKRITHELAGIPNKSNPNQNTKSIAVLPFVNLSQDASQEYFSDGITENILVHLASMRQLRVISRTSITRYKKTTKSAPEIAAELGVKYILEGSAQTHGNKVRIQVQLIDAEKDDHLWSKVFVENMDDIFAIQNSVAEIVAKELNSSIGSQESEKLKVVPTKNLEAYDLFLKGRHAFNQWGVEGYQAATEYFKKALLKDPDFREAYSYLASSYSARMSWNGDLSPGEALKNIEQYLNEAWKRGPSDNDYLTKAFVEFFINKHYSSSETLFLQAIEMSPNNATTFYMYSYLLNMSGRFEEAVEWVNKAKAIDPLTVAYFNYQTICLYLQKQHEQALLTIKEALQLYPSVLRLHDFLARIYLTIGKYSETVETINNGLSASKLRPPSMVAYLACAYIGLKNEVKFKLLLDELIARSTKNEKGVNIYLVYVYNAMNNMTSAIEWLIKAKKTNDVDLIWWDVDPLLQPIRDHLRDNGMQSPTADFAGAEKQIATLLENKMPKLPYHNKEHIYDVLKSALAIAETEKLNEEGINMLRVATLFHDAGFTRSSSKHEEHGVQLAREMLPAHGFDANQIETICNMIMATHIPQTPHSKLEKILCDADLDYLGRDDFYAIGGRLLEEMKMSDVVETEREWNIMQKTFLESHRFHTDFSKANREASKRERLKEIVLKLNNRK